MTSKQRVLRTFSFELPDRVPLYDGYWPEFVMAWRHAKGLPQDANIQDHYGVDIRIAVGDETLTPSRAAVLEETAEHRIERDGWGQVKRVRKGGYFFEQLEANVKTHADLDRLRIDPPDMRSRYERLDAAMPRLKERFAVFAKTGGPFIRTCFVRGDASFLMDMASDPEFAAALAMRITDHLIAIGREELRRWRLQDTGIWIYDDMASVTGPMFSPAMAERILAPCWRKMVTAYRKAGAKHVILHSDGNIAPILDLLLDCGFEGINPVEYSAGLDALDLRERYGRRLILIGGLDNAGILPRGDRREVKEHVLRVLAAGRDGGLVLGMHSAGPDIAVETYDYAIELLREYGTYPMVR
ncbi:MAG: uroporphyrinogen decarboxylase family protein [Armatimonadota bacterium]|jgi:uroporphyrinogen-III decarboxylase